MGYWGGLDRSQRCPHSPFSMSSFRGKTNTCTRAFWTQYPLSLTDPTRDYLRQANRQALVLREETLLASLLREDDAGYFEGSTVPHGASCSISVRVGGKNVSVFKLGRIVFESLSHFFSHHKFTHEFFHKSILKGCLVGLKGLVVFLLAPSSSPCAYPFNRPSITFGFCFASFWMGDIRMMRS